MSTLINNKLEYQIMTQAKKKITRTPYNFKYTSQRSAPFHLNVTEFEYRSKPTDTRR